MLRIISVGKIKEKYLIDAIKEYEKRITKYFKIEFIELLDEGKLDKKSSLKKEGDKILQNLSNGFTILLDRSGNEMDSIMFSKKIEEILITNANINFIIGGSYGVDEKVIEKADLVLSFSKFTFPHQVFKVLLLEQIYRACKIINNEEYHK